jgi:hypothetical protein
MSDQKKKMGRPVADTEPVMIRMTREMIKAIDDYRRTQEDLPTRPEVIRRVLAEWLERVNASRQ